MSKIFIKEIVLSSFGFLKGIAAKFLGERFDEFLLRVLFFSLFEAWDNWR